jgi:hypothetical protein
MADHNGSTPMCPQHLYLGSSTPITMYLSHVSNYQWLDGTGGLLSEPLRNVRGTGVLQQRVHQPIAGLHQVGAVDTVAVAVHGNAPARCAGTCLNIKVSLIP